MSEGKKTAGNACDNSIEERPNTLTAAAIEEGRRLAEDSSAPRYSSIEELRKALEE
jgi:hypothetical protein